MINYELVFQSLQMLHKLLSPMGHSVTKEDAIGSILTYEAYIKCIGNILQLEQQILSEDEKTCLKAEKSLSVMKQNHKTLAKNLKTYNKELYMPYLDKEMHTGKYHYLTKDKNSHLK